MQEINRASIHDPLLFSASVAVAITPQPPRPCGSHSPCAPTRSAASTLATGQRRDHGAARSPACPHYTGHAAANFAPDTICLGGPLANNNWMAWRRWPSSRSLDPVRDAQRFPSSTHAWSRRPPRWALVPAGGQCRAATPRAARQPDKAAEPVAPRGPRAGGRSRNAPSRGRPMRRALRPPGPVKDPQRLARSLRRRHGPAALLAERLPHRRSAWKTRCRDWAATSSWCSSSTSRVRRTPAMSRGRSSRRWRSPSSSTSTS